MAKSKRKVRLTLVPTGSRPGPAKKPLSHRKKLTDHPHHNRAGPPDIDPGKLSDQVPMPPDCPYPLGSLEKECWDELIASQEQMGLGCWLYRADCQYLMSHCNLYAEWQRVRKELNDIKESGGYFYNVEEGKMNPLVDAERKLIVSFQASLKALGMIPSRRTLIEAEPDDGEDEGSLLAI